MSNELPKVKMKLIGEDGNAFAILGRFKAAARRAGWTPNDITRIIGDAMEGDYNHLLAVVAKHCENGGM